MKISKTIELPEGAAQRFAALARESGVAVRLIYPTKLGGLFAVVLTFEFALELRGAQVTVSQVPA